MTRSLLRASQLRDEDVMEEAEHDAWVHVDLVTSGTVNFQDGTISGTGDIYANTYYGDGSDLAGIPTASEIIQSHTYEVTLTSGTDTITLDFNHEDFGTAYVDGVRQMLDAFSFSGENKIVFGESLPSDTKISFTHLVADGAVTYYTQAEVDTISGSLQSQIDDLQNQINNLGAFLIS